MITGTMMDQLVHLTQKMFTYGKYTSNFDHVCLEFITINAKLWYKLVNQH